MRTPPFASCLAALTLLLAACGSSDPKAEGLLALQSGEYEQAVAKLETALASTGPASPDFKEVAMGHCSALAYLDGEKARTAFEELASQCALSQADYSGFISHLVKARRFVPAVELLDQALKEFPEDPLLEEEAIRPIDDVLAPPDDAPTREFLVTLKEKALAKANQEPESEEARRLQSMGYLGGGD